MAGKIDDKIKPEFLEKFQEVAKEAWKHDDFKETILKTINSSVDIQTCIKKLVWQTVKEKVGFLLIGAAIFIGLNFAQSLIGEIASYSAKVYVDSQQKD